MIPYRVSVLVPNSGDRQIHEVKLFGAYAETDAEALRVVSDVIPASWRVDRIAGMLSRVEVERLRLTHGEVRELSSFTIDGLFLPEEAVFSTAAVGGSDLH